MALMKLQQIEGIGFILFIKQKVYLLFISLSCCNLMYQACFANLSKIVSHLPNIKHPAGAGNLVHAWDMKS